MKKYILPFRDLVVSPGLTVPALIDNQMSVACIKAASKAEGQEIILVPQNTWSYPTDVKDIYDVGTIGEIIQVLSMPDGAMHILVKTRSAVKLSEMEVNSGIFTGVATTIEVADDMFEEKTLMLRDIVADNMEELAQATRKFKIDKLRNVIANYPLPAFVDSVIQTADVDNDTAVKVLAATSWSEKLTILLEAIKLLLETAKIEESIAKYKA